MIFSAISVNVSDMTSISTPKRSAQSSFSYTEQYAPLNLHWHVCQHLEMTTLNQTSGHTHPIIFAALTSQ